MVRLKGSEILVPKISNPGFNSKMVRLKEKDNS